MHCVFSLQQSNKDAPPSPPAPAGLDPSTTCSEHTCKLIGYGIRDIHACLLMVDDDLLESNLLGETGAVDSMNHIDGMEGSLGDIQRMKNTNNLKY